MRIQPLAGPEATAAVRPPGAVPRVGGGDFDRHLAQALTDANPSADTVPGAGGPRSPSGPPTAPANQAAPVEGAGAAETGAEAAARFVDRITSGRRALDGLIASAANGRTFSPQELLGVQARAYRYVQDLELAGKVVEQTSSAVKRTLGTQL